MTRILSLFIALGLVLATANAANAQTCSTTDKATLKTCVDTGVEVCRDASACNDYEPVLTVRDVAELAIIACCNKKTKTARSVCLVNQVLKFSPKSSSGSQKTFFKAAKAAIKNVRTNVCKSSKYTLPADSALF